MAVKLDTRQNGIYYTALFNPFKSIIFKNWVQKHNIQNERVLEPFAGCNSIITMLQEIGMAYNFTSYDKYPKSKQVKKRDTLASYPKGYKVCITNPPWLYKSSAHRLGLEYPNTCYDDIYKLCLAVALDDNEYVGALIPASFIQSKLFTDRLETIMFLNKPLFKNTESPVCLALFGNKKTKEIEIYNDDIYLGEYAELQNYLPPVANNTKGSIEFNNPSGDLGFIAIDNHKEPSIRFCHGKELEKYKISQSSRAITRIRGVDVNNGMLKKLNDCIVKIRDKTSDVFLTTFKGLRKDGKYRRRMEYTLARGIIDYAQ